MSWEGTRELHNYLDKKEKRIEAQEKGMLYSAEELEKLNQFKAKIRQKLNAVKSNGQNPRLTVNLKSGQQLLFVLDESGDIHYTIPNISNSLDLEHLEDLENVRFN